MSILLLLAAVQTASMRPDYVATLRSPYAEGTGVIRSHAGATRTDLPTSGGDVEVRYDAPGRPAMVIVTRNSAGEIRHIGVRRRRGPRATEADWQGVGQATIAGEACALQRTTIAEEWPKQRCLTVDGVNLMPPPNGRAERLQTLTRGPVDAEDVRPPLELLDLARWVSPGALADRSGRDTSHDYVATFATGQGQPEGAVRRSGAWIADTATWLRGSLILTNAETDLTIAIAGMQGNDLEIGFVRKSSAFPFEPTPLRGRPTETLFGETCTWRSRLATPDFRQFECRTVDGALLALGPGGGAAGFQAATSFRRQPVPLASLLPDPQLLTPQYYGLQGLAP